MFEALIIWEWIGFLVRWLHVITAIAWIGSSFYFIALDLGLIHRPHLPKGAHGEEWQVHGGGFYHIQKYLVAPENMPEHLTWFKWEAYVTWISGFALMCVVYYVGADIYLIDRNVLDISQPVAIFISIASIALGWILYDSLCKSKIGESSVGLMLVLFCILVGMAWGYTQLFTGRAALLHLGAFTATIMSANVFMIIIPNQKIVVADLMAGRTPDPKYGKIAKQRSTHNNYLTLPVIFLMLSNHYPLAFATEYNWIIASLIFLIGVLIRHYFNSKHARIGKPTWVWLAAAIIFVIIMWLSTAPQFSTADDETALTPSPQQLALMQDPHFETVKDTILGRCSMCHSKEPFYEGVHRAPKGVLLEDEYSITQHAGEIYIQAGRSHAMPPGNVTQMSEEERAKLIAWYQSATNK
jgi:uncharacterized membrane protein